MNIELVDIGTKKLEVCTYGSGNPVVVIETGLGCSFYDWNMVANEIAKAATVICYHRAGYGESTIGEEECTTMQIAKDLNKMLENKKITCPIILVGHSFGGLCVHQYAQLYPNKVGGIVLVDSVSAYEYEMDEIREKLTSFKKQFSKTDIINIWNSLFEKSIEELKEVINPKLLPGQLNFSEELQKCILDFQVNSNLYKAMASELKNMAKCGKEMKNNNELLHIPLKVLCRDTRLAINWNVDNGIPKEEAVIFESKWKDVQEKQAELSSKGEFLLVENSTHSIYRSNPQVVINKIKEVINVFKF